MPVTAETGVLQFVDVKDFTQSSAPKFTTNAVIGDVTTTYVPEYGFYNVVLPFTYTTLDGDKQITINKKINVRLEQFTAPFQKNMKELYAQWNVVKKAFATKEERQAQFSGDGWRQLWAYTFDIEGILLPLLRLGKIEIRQIVTDGNELDCSILGGLTASVNVGPEYGKEQFKTVLKVNGRAR